MTSKAMALRTASVADEAAPILTVIKHGLNQSFQADPRHALYLPKRCCEYRKDPAAMAAPSTSNKLPKMLHTTGSYLDASRLIIICCIHSPAS
jgi:hypothetical protein